ncbi:hypothetical protein OIU34_20485 [Pararhizobium sp. BT-229]|uniref:hypothetical protein n=1 Tax=Pararhizobium sp. BT-229 TaxID=2986923 RepID=UPI0021F6C6E5|nr:hypothetical protein [Pararhizobium sp. BT-229]MCV9964267.1 hypothetical protein [Pararhizobium sp. BT-229]
MTASCDLVYQVEGNGYRFDIASSYAAAMRRLLHCAMENKKHGARVAANYAAFSGMDVKAHCDPTMTAIRYSVAIIPEQFAIAEHRLRRSPEESSFYRQIDIMTEFDPTFEILLHLHCVVIGQYTLRKATKELTKNVETGVKGTVRSLRSEAAVIEHLRDVRDRNGGIDFLSDGMTSQNLISTLPERALERFRAIAGGMGL